MNVFHLFNYIYNKLNQLLGGDRLHFYYRDHTSMGSNLCFCSQDFTEFLRLTPFIDADII